MNDLDSMLSYDASKWLFVKPVGYYRVGNGQITLNIEFDKKPSRWHRFWTRIFLGWEWRDG